MFTGIIEHMGTVVSIVPQDTSSSGGNGWSVTVGDSSVVLTDCHIGDSIAVNGTCLTVTEFDKDWFKLGIAPETLRKTNLGDLKVGDKVNLERAMAAGQRFGGHMVQVLFSLFRSCAHCPSESRRTKTGVGHVDSPATITSITPEENSLWFRFTLPDSSLLPYIIPKGFIAIDGTSLTVCDVNDRERWFTIMMIAHTQNHVVQAKKQVGDRVNIEVDMVGKYALKHVEGLFAGLTGKGREGEESILEKLVRNVLEEKGKI
ncbi:alpha subunit of riboflavin synthase [Jimgerdemannia flammicorona]|uniref:Riboflavin synthase n=1 Tax=Jimgerdemannia flammicorona TaxID=994334 RepID=A0A433DJ29_9FUNG|nr:alpha subunit of riboflavin synthase [Jimgerdemannia flammicorona]